MEIAFFILLLLAVYSYMVFPPLSWVLQIFLRRPWGNGPHQLSVSMIISVYNEASVIREKIENALSLEYPEELLEIIISSDGSTDKTHDIVLRFNDPRVVLKRFERVGKTECLNRVVPEAKGDIILFTDANSMFPPDLLNQVSSNFVDPDVGLVTGWTKYVKAGGGEDVTGIYAKLEKITKHWESLVCSCVGADGAVFAIRKSLYRPLDAGDINDFIIPLNVVAQKKRVVLDPMAYCLEEATEDEKKAFRRQVRITTRTLWAIRCNLGFLNFREFGVFSFFLLSHKVLRLAAPFFLLLASALNIVLVRHSWIYSITLAGFVLFIGIGSLGFLGLVKGSAASICKFFLITLSAQFVGWLRMAAGIKDTTWTPKR
jgi:cellulose synthase/poly-beta-1,6-N-acetylglucosamine synthase-like glycosyltransferase